MPKPRKKIYNGYTVLRMSLRIVICLILETSFVYSQPLPTTQSKTSSEAFDLAKSYYEKEQYKEALSGFEALLQMDPENANLNFLAGHCIWMVSDHPMEAQPLLEKAVKSTSSDYSNTLKERKAPLRSFQILGDLYYDDYRFDDAANLYKLYKNYLDVKKEKAEVDQLSRKIDACSFAKVLLNSPLKVTLTEIPFTNVISYMDFGAYLCEKGNCLYFSRRRQGISEPNGNSDIFYMYNTDGIWSRPVRMPFINSDADDNICWVSADGNRILFSSDRGGNFDLYLTERTGKSQWKEPEPLGMTINDKSSELAGWMSEDGKWIVFSSDRKGGMGGWDLYSSTKGEQGLWSSPQNLGIKVNTPGDEETPFFDPETKRLYFSTNGRDGIGGYDVYYSIQQTGNTWSDPKNAGYPVNTTGDDVFYRKSTSGRPDHLVSRSRKDKSVFSISAMNDSDTAPKPNERKDKESNQEKPRLKLVPKTLKY